MKIPLETPTPHIAPTPPQPSVKIPKLTLILSIVVLIGLVVFVVLNVDDARKFAKLLEEAEPVWLLLMVTVQVVSYLCAGAIWGVVARAAKFLLSLGAMARLAVEKLSIDQVIPTGGMVGNVVVFQAMRRMGLPEWLAMEALLMDTLAYYGAYFIAILVAIIAFWINQVVSPTVMILLAAFSVIMVGVPLGIAWLLKHKDRQPPHWLMRLKPFVRFYEMAASVSTARIVRPSILGLTVLLNFGVFALDGLTFWVGMHALGISVSPLTMFVALIMGQIAGAVSFLPGGIGGFELGATTALTLFGVPLEAALAGTLLLRGFTLWLPLVPGLLLARRDVHIGLR